MSKAYCDLLISHVDSMHILCEVDSIIGINSIIGITLGLSPPCVPVSLKLWHAFERHRSQYLEVTASSCTYVLPCSESELMQYTPCLCLHDIDILDSLIPSTCGGWKWGRIRSYLWPTEHRIIRDQD